MYSEEVYCLEKGMITLLKALFENFHDEFQIFIDCMTDAVFIMQVTEDGFRYVAMNNEGMKRANISKDAIGKLLEDVLPTRIAELLNDQYQSACEKKQPISYEFKRRDGHIDESILSPITYKSSEVQYILSITRDITKKKHYEEHFRHMAFHDSLTDLPNRNLFKLKLKEEFLRFLETKVPFSIMYMDFDNFKQINDELGHDAGDEFLRELSSRLKSYIRSADIIARVGGDEFTVLITCVTERNQVEEIAARMIESMAKPWVYRDRKLAVTLSIGLTWSDENSDIDTMIKQADQALYITKKEGKNGYSWYDSSKLKYYS